jgi:hypothetical protein
MRASVCYRQSRRTFELGRLRTQWQGESSSPSVGRRETISGGHLFGEDATFSPFTVIVAIGFFSETDLARVVSG